MKVQISNKRIIHDAMTVWHAPGPDVDICMPKNMLSFAPASIDRLYAFHALEMALPDQIGSLLANWKACLKPGARIYIVNDDLEYIARSLIGGDLNVAQWNDMFTHPSYFSRDSVIDHLKAAGFPMETITLWYADVTGEFAKQPYELVTHAENL